MREAGISAAERQMIPFNSGFSALSSSSFQSSPPPRRGPGYGPCEAAEARHAAEAATTLAMELERERESKLLSALSLFSITPADPSLEADFIREALSSGWRGGLVSDAFRALFMSLQIGLCKYSSFSPVLHTI